jgi:hypothetical protein
MAFETIIGEQLRQKLADWTLRNKKGLPLPKDSGAADFLESFRLPEADFEFTQSFVDGDGEVKALFKTSVRLLAWQTRGGREPSEFSYYKIMKAVTDDDGNVTDYVLCGYVVTDI